MKSLGAYEAKTHFTQLLRAVEKGKSVTITKHGIPVAILSPVGAQQKRSHADRVIEELLNFRKGRTLGVSVRQVIESGRR